MALTYIDALNTVIPMVDGEVAEKLNALKAQLSKKRTSSKPTAKQVENEAIKAKIADVLARANENGMTVGEILKVIDGEYTTAKISALLTQMKNADIVERTMEKKVARYSLR